MKYKNYTTKTQYINGEKVEPFIGAKSLKPQEDTLYILPPKMWRKVKHRTDVIKGEEK